MFKNSMIKGIWVSLIIRLAKPGLTKKGREKGRVWIEI